MGHSEDALVCSSLVSIEQKLWEEIGLNVVKVSSVLQLHFGVVCMVDL